MTRLLKSLLPVLLLFLAAAPIMAQFAAPGDFLDKSNRHLVVDWAAFRSEDSSLVRLELYYQISTRGWSSGGAGSLGGRI
jgi:hypothetical protein